MKKELIFIGLGDFPTGQLDPKVRLANYCGKETVFSKQASFYVPKASPLKVCFKNVMHIFNIH